MIHRHSADAILKSTLQHMFLFRNALRRTTARIYSPLHSLLCIPLHALSSHLNPTTQDWNSIIKTHVDSGSFDAALSLFAAMRKAGAQADHYTFPIINRAIAHHTRLAEALHCLAVKLGFAANLYFCNTMIQAYARNGVISFAHQLFDEMCTRDVVSWTSLISGYAQIGDSLETFLLLHHMRVAGFEPSPVTLAVLLRACLVTQDKAGGVQLYGFVIKVGFESHELVQNSVLTMISKLACCDEEVKKVFDGIGKRTVASWNILISFYSSSGQASRAADCYWKMKVDELTPSQETLTLLVSALAKCKDLPQGRMVHCTAIKSAQTDVILLAAFVDFYSKCGEVESAALLFEEAQIKSSVTWNVMMRGFIQNGEYLMALNIFRRMQKTGPKPSKDALRAVILVYSHLGALMLGRGVHGYIMRNTFEVGSDDTLVKTSILNMYAKCGSIVLAQRCFDQIVAKDTVAWTSIIDGYAIHGLSFKALELFYQMRKEGIRPNSVTFLSLLSSCSYSGLLREGCELLDCMTDQFGINPDLRHYTCLVDLLGRSGKLQEALDVINQMKTVPDSRIWGALLASCRTHSDVLLGNYAAKKLFDLEPDNIGYQVILSNIFADAEMWDETEKSWKSMGMIGFKKKPGWSSIQVKGSTSMFVSGDRSHPQVGNIYEILASLARQNEEL